MSLLFEKNDENVRVMIPSKFVVDEVAKFRSIINDSFNNGQKQFIIDFRNCEFIDSTGLGVLVSVYKKCSELKGSLKLCAINNPHVLKVFTLTKLDSVFEIYSTFEEAKN